ncbi:MAG TPA: DNA repair protein RecN [Deltaproteobacteria bacterium]|nr:DNA repair protein RecN [Deltaproteobacteria bacterium]
MLKDLSIRNFAIIDELNVSFGDGLNVISGETGAGKSIIIGAVSLLLGERAASDMIRTHEDSAVVEALFDISACEALRQQLAEMGFLDSDELVIRRVISRTGKNKALINGQMATLANLAQVSEALINICGQHEHQVILDAQNHIDILDEFGDCLGLSGQYYQTYGRYQQIRAQTQKLQELRRSREEKTELLRFQLKEITEINPEPDEDTRLADEKKILQNAQRLTDLTNRAYDLLYGEKESVCVKLKDVQNQVSQIRNIDSGLGVSDKDIEAAFISLQEAALTLRDYGKNLFFDPEKLTAIDERLEALGTLKRKHGGSLESVMLQKQKIEEELRQVFSVEEELEKLGQEEVAVGENLARQALFLSEKRNESAAKLKSAVEREIHELNMPHATFEAFFKTRAADKKAEDYGPKGGDEIEFYLAANAGEALKPLNKIASGGELSRIVLALKNVLSRTGSVATIIFDEVDNGIGGATAEIVGRKLKEVSANHQVICITHLPQIASYGREHFFVSKKVVKGRTVTSVSSLDDQQKVEEISRMLGGVDVTQATREHAREMINSTKGQGAPKC